MIAKRIWFDGIPSDGGDAGFVAVTVAIFGILITGIFVFMTFRIDRGAIIEDHRTAKSEAELVLREATKVAEAALADANQTLEEARDRTSQESIAASVEAASREQIASTAAQLRLNVMKALANCEVFVTIDETDVETATGDRPP